MCTFTRLLTGPACAMPFVTAPCQGLNACLRQGTCCFVQVAGQVANTTQQLAALLAAGSASRQHHSLVQLQPFDHILAPVGATARAVQALLQEGTARLALLYGAIGTACSEQLHAQLLAAAAEGARLCHDACMVYWQPCRPAVEQAPAAGTVLASVIGNCPRLSRNPLPAEPSTRINSSHTARPAHLNRVAGLAWRR